MKVSMMMNTHTLIKISLVGLILLVIVSACGVIENQGAAVNVEEKAQTIVAMTLESEHQIQTIVAATINAANEESVLTPTTTDSDTLRISNPTKTPDTAMLSTATITATPTPETPMVNVSMDTNCRKGPGTIYDYIGALLVGESAEVVGVSTDGQYWIIKNPDRPGECWLWGRYATVTGSIDMLPKFTPPPTPTPAATATPTVTPTSEYNWTGSWKTSFGVPNMMHESFGIALTQSGSTVSGTFTLGTNTFTLSGSLSADMRTLTGTWYGPNISGPFSFYLISLNQFTGNRDSGVYEWCGYRAGAELPSNCMGP